MASIIYNDLHESDYIFEYDKIKFVFSSKFYLENFKKRYQDYLKSETDKLYAKYKTSIFADYLILYELYCKIEKRGFLMYYKGKEINEFYFNIEIA